MEDITIPGWALWVYGAFGTIWLSWMIVLTKMAFDTKSDMRIANEKDALILYKIETVQKNIDENKLDTNERFKEIKSSIDRLFGKIEDAIKR